MPQSVTPPRFTHWVLLLLACLSQPLAAQQDVEFSNGAPVAPEGLEIPPLPAEDRVYDTAEGMPVEVHVEARGLEHPWSIAFLPDGNKLVSERNSGRLRLIRNGELVADPVDGVPAVAGNDYTGLMDLALHPDFADNQLLYFTYSKPLPDEESAIAVGRGRWDGRALQETGDVYVAGPGTGAGSRLVFGRDGMLYFSLFGGGEDAQDPQTLRGKVLRITPEGEVPADNPFVGREGYRPEIFTLGHRTITGLAEHPGTGRLWAVEMGPNGGDEINILEPGANYGWPEVSLGRSYPGPWQSEQFQDEGFTDPVAFWMPAISVSGLAFYTGEALHAWTGDVFVGGLRYGEVPGTGRLQRILINQDMEELRREDLLLDLRRRIRDVREGPDGFLYVLTDDDNGAVLRIEPAKAP